MFPNKPIVMNSEAFRYFHVLPLTVKHRLLVPRKETFLYTPSCYSKLNTTSPRAAHLRFTGYLIRVYGPKPCPCVVNWIILPYKSSGAIQKMDALVCVTLLTPKGTQPFKYMIAQFLSNMELYLSWRM
jgi:hypothetical protein